MKKIISLILIFTSLQSWADCSQPVTYMQLGDKAQCEGYLFTRQAEADNRTQLDLGASYKELNDLKDKKIDILSQRVDLYKTGYEDSVRMQSNNNLDKYLYFAAGILITYGAFRLASQVNGR